MAGLPLDGPGLAGGWHLKLKGSISKTVNRNANGALQGPMTFVWNVSMLLDIGLYTFGYQDQDNRSGIRNLTLNRDQVLAVVLVLRPPQEQDGAGQPLMPGHIW